MPMTSTRIAARISRCCGRAALACRCRRRCAQALRAALFEAFRWRRAGAGRRAFFRHDRGFSGRQLRGPAGHLLWILDYDSLERALLQCWASLYSVPSISYRRRRDMPENDVSMAVVVQRMVDSRTAGVMFTRSPTSGDRSVIVDRGRLGAGVGRGRRRGDAGPLGGGQDHRRESRCARSATSTSCMRPARAGGTQEVEVDAARRTSPA